MTDTPTPHDVPFMANIASTKATRHIKIDSPGGGVFDDKAWGPAQRRKEKGK